MKTCPECHVLVEGPQKYCPLCGAALQSSDISGKDETLYPLFSQPLKQRSRFPFLAKLFAFLSLTVILICGLIDMILNHQLT